MNFDTKHVSTVILVLEHDTGPFFRYGIQGVSGKGKNSRAHTK
jgi:hypothetical protein